MSQEATRATDARDRVRALELLAKYHGLQTEQVAVRALPQDPKQLDDLLMMELSRVKGIPVALLAPAKRGQRLKDPLTDPRGDEGEVGLRPGRLRGRPETLTEITARVEAEGDEDDSA